MAKADSKTVKTVKMVEQVVTEKQYTLTLSAEEADIVAGVLGRFKAGGPTSDIWHALREAGVPTLGNPYEVHQYYYEDGSTKKTRPLVLKKSP